MEDKNRFSILLEHLLEVAEVKNYTLAKRLQYDVSYISKWVSGRMLPAKKTEKRVMEGISACVVDEATHGCCQHGCTKTLKVFLHSFILP